jgi:hypothetical protein
VGLQHLTAMSQRTEVRFDARLYTIDKWTFLRLPEKASGKLPSRGQVAVQGTINGHRFPDGVGTRRLSWPLDEDCWKATTNRRSSAGDAATLEIETLKDLPEPERATGSEESSGSCPAEDPRPMESYYADGAGNGSAGSVNATPNADTRKRRVEVSISKMKSGKRRPCCFNLAACTDPSLSRNGRLITSG